MDMSKDPAFLFYPGDYLADIQLLNINARSVYTNIMCAMIKYTDEHMSNICVGQTVFDLLTKNLTEEEKKELLSVVDKTEKGYQIYWVAASIAKRKSYIISRSKNRNKHMINICKTYDRHMEIEIEKEIEKENNMKLNKTSCLQKYKEQFEAVVKTYPGVKRGSETEFYNFIKKHKKWREFLPLLLPAISEQINKRINIKSKNPNAFIPEWKHFYRWIDKKSWEEKTNTDNNDIDIQRKLEFLSKDEDKNEKK